MKLADITMAGELLDIADEMGKNSSLSLLSRLRANHSLVLVNDEMTAMVIYDPITQGKWAAHIAAAKEVRGKQMFDFAHQTAVWMVKKQKLEHLLCFVKVEHRALKRFVQHYGMQLAATIGRELLYVTNREQILKFASQKQEVS